jgi:hypothetical protein
LEELKKEIYIGGVEEGETFSLIETTGALEKVTPEWKEANKGKYDVIGTKFVYKEKIKPDGTHDKFKCRGSLRRDELTRLLRALGIKPPTTYSPNLEKCNLNSSQVKSLSEGILHLEPLVKYSL